MHRGPGIGPKGSIRPEIKAPKASKHIKRCEEKIWRGGKIVVLRQPEDGVQQVPAAPITGGIGSWNWWQKAPKSETCKENTKLAGFNADNL